MGLGPRPTTTGFRKQRVKVVRLGKNGAASETGERVTRAGYVLLPVAALLAGAEDCLVLVAEPDLPGEAPAGA